MASFKSSGFMVYHSTKTTLVKDDLLISGNTVAGDRGMTKTILTV